MAQIYMSHVTHMAQIYMSHVTHMAQIYMSHVTHMAQIYMSPVHYMNIMPFVRMLGFFERYWECSENIKKN